MIRRGFIKAAYRRGQIAATHADPDKLILKTQLKCEQSNSFRHKLATILCPLGGKYSPTQSHQQFSLIPDKLRQAKSPGTIPNKPIFCPLFGVECFSSSKVELAIGGYTSSLSEPIAILLSHSDLRPLTCDLLTVDLSNKPHPTMSNSTQNKEPTEQPQPKPQVLEEDDEFEDFPIEGTKPICNAHPDIQANHAPRLAPRRSRTDHRLSSERRKRASLGRELGR